jgi:hypothetical protein
MKLFKLSLLSSIKVVMLALLVIAAGATGGSLTGSNDPLAKMAQPRYNEAKELLFPENYDSWVFVGASIGLSYTEATRVEGPGVFHHVYLQPEAYAHFKRTGQFPEKTMLVMELHQPEQKVSINKQGYFQGERIGVEAAVKDHSKFQEGWAYFDFRNGAKKSAAAFPNAACFSCHKQHAANDNVFTQFYPALRDAKQKK